MSALPSESVIVMITLDCLLCAIIFSSAFDQINFVYWLLCLPFTSYFSDPNCATFEILVSVRRCAYLASQSGSQFYQEILPLPPEAQTGSRWR